MTKIENLSKEIGKQLLYYAKDVQEKVDEAMEETTTKLVNDLKKDSPQNRPKYFKGWKVKKSKGSYVVHNKEHQLTHLLEHGHVLRNGKRFKGKVHIRPNEEKAVKEYLNKVERAIEQR